MHYAIFEAQDESFPRSNPHSGYNTASNKLWKVPTLTNLGAKVQALSQKAV
ncbi:hypothetical protein ABIE78_003935 [Sinorhizobium fredii]|jgi:hypothetical protein